MRETLYRLKKEAVPFFNEELATKILRLETWTKQYNVDQNALEEIKVPYIKYGHNGKDFESICGWSNPAVNGQDNGGSHFNFTIYFPSMKMREHDIFSKGRIMRELMNSIQRVADSFYLEFEENLPQ